MTKAVLVSIVVAAVSINTVNAWWCDGHMIVSNVAMQFVEADTFAKVQKMTKLLAPYYPKSPEPITAACWADDLKADGVYGTADWHFANHPVLQTSTNFSIPGHSAENVEWAIEKCRQVLTAPNATALDKARYLRFLLHFVGDIHQPLHGVTLYAPYFPTGDQGGNKFLIKGANETELHAFWDSGAGMWSATQPRPLPKNSSDWIDSIAQDVSSEFPKSTFTDDLAKTDVSAWTADMFSTVLSTVYGGITNGGTVSSAYIIAARTYSRRQVALAGYRLAQELDTLLRHDVLPEVHLRGGSAL